ncbi:hypothetical protein PCIT_a2209 [Pseudoalteromonas citrea]|uniref:Cadherin domain-containing protein n=2 Tax=Pseudoalteromonas citrea TaxID=43655 RepID=A0AAD4AJD7_9GAMM|nr:hypothetical protein [Pseudoalteromonas citrea]KAF7772188.1 hypothetical protein PCIT_a2209 [Pseudoalteromonas citrea]
MAKRLIFLFFCGVLLNGCGGGSNNQEPTTSTVNNTAPLLSGIVDTDIKALEEFVLELAASDKEGDVISFRIDNKPQWLNYEQKDSVIQLTGTPGFLDIGEYQVDLKVTDGVLSTDYKLAISVLDNETKWAPIDITQSDIEGGWQNQQENLALVMNSKQRGVLFADDELKEIDYQIEKGVEVSWFDDEVGENKRLFSFDILDKRDGQLRVVMRNDKQVKALTLARLERPEETLTFSIDDGADSRIRLFELANTPESESLIRIPKAKGESNYNNLSGSYNSANGEFMAASPTFLDGTYAIPESWELETAELEATIESLSILGVFNGVLFYNSVVSYTSAVTPEEVQDNDRAWLASVLAGPVVNTNTLIMQPLLKAEAPTFKVGGVYTSGLLIQENVQFNERDVHLNSAVFEVLDQNTLQISWNFSGKIPAEIYSFEYAFEGELLKLTRNGKTTSHRFLMMPNGHVGMDISFFNDGESQRRSRNLVIFKEVDTRITQDDYFHTFVNREAGHRVMQIIPNENKLESGNFIRWEANGSVTVLRGSCDLADSFEACEAYLNSQEYVNAEYENYKMLYKSDDFVLFEYLRYSMSGDILQSLRTFNIQ